MASPFFFIRKKDGKLQPVQDYRKLNDMTRKNHYPHHSSLTLLIPFRTPSILPSTMSNGDIIIFALKKEMNGKQLFEQIVVFTN
jgi:hypothetical protein